MADKARIATDKELAKMERHLSAIYTRASKEVGETWKGYLADVGEEIKPLQEAYDAAKRTGDQEAVKKTGKALAAKQREKTIMDKHYKALTEQLAVEITHVNETATAYVNGRLPEVYALNYNGVGEGIEKAVSGYSFELVDAATVKNLATTDKTLLPYKMVDGKKDVRWNTQKINSEVLQGILQGESMDKIAGRLGKVEKMNEGSAIRNARTSVTSAENKGRMDVLHNAAEKGVITHKVWLSSNQPGRTRHWHLPGDFEEIEVDIDEPFVNSIGEIMYPGDPSADPANVYNCRCSLAYKVVGFAAKESEQPEIDFSSLDGVIDHSLLTAAQEYSKDMSPEYIEKFNSIFKDAEFRESDNGTYYDPTTNSIAISKDEAEGHSFFHEGTHYYDYNQNYTITDDWGYYRREYDEDGKLIGKEWVPNVVTIKENAGFSEYVSYEWGKYGHSGEDPMSSIDLRNFVSKTGTSDTYGYARAEAANDVRAINNYLKNKGVSKSDPDFGHLSDFISAISYDSNLGSLITGGHSYDYWVSGDEKRVTEIVAAYNVLEAKGRSDLVEVMDDLAPNLMQLIKTEWRKIW